jgi:hypothetical protein
MLDGIVARNSLIEVCSAFRQSSRTQQGSAHEAMPNHERDRRPLLLGEGEELRGKIARDVAFERHGVRDPEAVEDGEQQQRVFRALSERFSSFDQKMCSLRSGLGFRRGKSLDVAEWGYERYLKLDLLTPQCGRLRQGRNLVKRTRELLNCFKQRRARQ